MVEFGERKTDRSLFAKGYGVSRRSLLAGCLLGWLSLWVHDDAVSAGRVDKSAGAIRTADSGALAESSEAAAAFGEFLRVGFGRESDDHKTVNAHRLPERFGLCMFGENITSATADTIETMVHLYETVTEGDVNFSAHRDIDSCGKKPLMYVYVYDGPVQVDEFKSVATKIVIWKHIFPLKDLTVFPLGTVNVVSDGERAIVIASISQIRDLKIDKQTKNNFRRLISAQETFQALSLGRDISNRGKKPRSLLDENPLEEIQGGDTAMTQADAVEFLNRYVDGPCLFDVMALRVVAATIEPDSKTSIDEFVAYGIQHYASLKAEAAAVFEQPEFSGLLGTNCPSLN